MAGRLPPTEDEWRAFVCDHPNLGYRAVGGHFADLQGAQGKARTSIVRRCAYLARKHGAQPVVNSEAHSPTTHVTLKAEPLTDFAELDPLEARKRMVRKLGQAVEDCTSPGVLPALTLQLSRALAELEELRPPPPEPEDHELPDEERHALLLEMAEQAPLDDLEVIVREYLRRTHTQLVRAENVIRLEDRQARGGE